MKIYQFSLDEDGLDQLVENIISTYELHLGTAQSAQDALEMTQDATIASIMEVAEEAKMETEIMNAMINSEGETKH